jgi:hypothetical protein
MFHLDTRIPWFWFWFWFWLAFGLELGFDKTKKKQELSVTISPKMMTSQSACKGVLCCIYHVNISYNACSVVQLIHIQKKKIQASLLNNVCNHMARHTSEYIYWHPSCLTSSSSSSSLPPPSLRRRQPRCQANQQPDSSHTRKRCSFLNNVTSLHPTIHPWSQR